MDKHHHKILLQTTSLPMWEKTPTSVSLTPVCLSFPSISYVSPPRQWSLTVCEWVEECGSRRCHTG